MVLPTPRQRAFAALLGLALVLRSLGLAAAPELGLVAFGAPAPNAATSSLVGFGVPTPNAATAPERAGGEPVAVCPDSTLPDGGVCVPVLDFSQGGEALAEQRAAHHDRMGRLRVYDQIPRRPERPADYRRYRLPVPALAEQSFVTSGYDLDQPDDEQRRGAEMKAVGHGGIDLAQKRGTPALLVPLEHQVGDADVLLVGKLFGNSVVTHHTLREGGVLRDYLVVYGHLEKPAAGLKRGDTLSAGAIVGYVGDSGSPGVVHLHWEARRARAGVVLGSLGAGELTQNAKTVACDPRNLLPLLP